MPLETLQTVLDFPKHSDLAISEGRKKLVGTYMYINNNLAYIKNMDSYGILHEFYNDPEEKLIPWSDVHELQVLMPKSGWYDLNSGGKIFVRKLRVKQWKKSFNFELYNFSEDLSNPAEIDWSSHSRLTISMNNRVFYYNSQIGFINLGKIYVTNLLFYQEILDTWGNQYDIEIAQ